MATRFLGRLVVAATFVCAQASAIAHGCHGHGCHAHGVCHAGFCAPSGCNGSPCPAASGCTTVNPQPAASFACKAACASGGASVATLCSAVPTLPAKAACTGVVALATTACVAGCVEAPSAAVCQ